MLNKQFVSEMEAKLALRKVKIPETRAGGHPGGGGWNQILRNMYNQAKSSGFWKDHTVSSSLHGHN